MSDAAVTQFGWCAFASVLCFAAVIGAIFCPSCFRCKTRTWFVHSYPVPGGRMDLCFRCKPKHTVGDRRRDDAA